MRAEPGAFVKRRRGWAPLLIWGAEALLRPRFHTLSGAAWQAQESALYAQLYGQPPARIPGGLRLPALPGVVLADYLRPAPADGPQALRAAVVALHALHQVEVAPGAGPFTHGDATAHNCLYEPAAARARWFDFETGHLAGLGLAERRADDLRALLFSAGAWLAEAPAVWLPPVMAAYPDPAVWSAWRRLASALTQRADPFHLAQTRLSPSASRDLARRLVVISSQ